jgi:hypothetical protein
MKQFYKLGLIVLSLLCTYKALSQNINSLSGSAKGDNSTFNFYNPLLLGSKSFTDGYFSSGHIQLLTDTTVLLDTSLQKYDLDSIPEQLVFYNTPCRFYLKSDSLIRAGKSIIDRKYYVVEGYPKGTIRFDRFNLFQYTTNVDTLEFSLKFALVTSTGDTVKSRRSVKFKVVPTLPYETATFGIGGQRGLPDLELTEFQVQSKIVSKLPKQFNFQNQPVNTVNFSGVQVLLKNGNSGNPLDLLNNTTNLDTLNIYAETLIIQGGYNFPSTTINIYAKELRFVDAAGSPAYLNTTPVSPPTPSTGAGEDGPKAGDIYLHISKFTANPGKRFILNGGTGQGTTTAGNMEGSGGNGGNVYSTIDVSDYMVSVGGHSASSKTKAQDGSFLLDPAYASWLHPNFLHLIVNYYKEGFYAGLTEPVVKNLKAYSDLIDQYVADGSLFQLEEDNVLQIAQISDEVNQVFFNISNNLDYYGNPPGWVPMLSFEVSKEAYLSEVSHAMNVLFLDKMVQSANTSLENRQNAFAQLRNEAQVVVEDNKSQFSNLAFTVIPDIKNNIEVNQEKISSLKQQLAELNAELDRRAKEKYDDRQTWKWVGVAGKVLSCIPTPYTMAAGAALSAGVQVFGSDDQRIGFGQGGQLAGVIANTIEPFTSGEVTSDVSTLGSNVSGGVSDIISKIGNIKSLADIKAIAAESKKLYDDNKQLYQNVSQSITGVVNLYNSVTRVDNDELGSIKGELIANEPRIGAIAQEMQDIAGEQQKLGHQLETSTQEMLSSKNNVYSGLTAISHFNDQIFDASAFDHKLAVFSNDMRRKAFERLRKYHYYMLKAYEYRTIDTTLGYLWSLNLSNVLLKIDSLVTIDKKTSLTETDFAALKSIYDSEIREIADKVFTYYVNNYKGGQYEATVRLRLNKDEIEDLNQGKTISINLVDKGLFPAVPTNYREDLRLINLAVTKVVLKPANEFNQASYDYLSFRFLYPNYSRVQKNGMIYSFNHYNMHTEHPITWGTDYDIISQKYDQITTSTASNSLLSSLFFGSKGAGNEDLYARPAAWADLKLSMIHTTNGNLTPQLDSLTVDVSYEFQYKPEKLVNVELNTNNKWFAPTFAVNTIDNYNRKNGIGNIYRTYSKSSAVSVTATAPLTYGRYTFTNWATRNGTPLAPGNGIDLSGGNTIKFSLAADRSFKAMYKFEGAILSVPDTVYLQDNLQYDLSIKNLGAGSLFWFLDSSSFFIRYPDSLSGANDSTITLKFDQNPDPIKNRIGVLDVSSTETESLHNYVYFVQKPRTSLLNYVFSGKGNWDTPENWSNKLVPPLNLPPGTEIIIDPIGQEECVLNVPRNIPNGVKLTVKAGKKLRVL